MDVAVLLRPFISLLRVQVQRQFVSRGSLFLINATMSVCEISMSSTGCEVERGWSGRWCRKKVHFVDAYETFRLQLGKHLDVEWSHGVPCVCCFFLSSDSMLPIKFQNSFGIICSIRYVLVTLSVESALVSSRVEQSPCYSCVRAFVDSPCSSYRLTSDTCSSAL